MAEKGSDFLIFDADGSCLERWTARLPDRVPGRLIGAKEKNDASYL
ncbi:MAG: hypothetical protein V1816_22605 [Pseudomonadota bacterium]